MSVLPWDTYSRIEITCDADAVTARPQVRVQSPAHFEYSVLDIDDTTVAPTTKADAMVKLAAALAWQAATFNISGAADASVYSRFELQNFFGTVTIVVACKVNGVIVSSDETELTIDNGGPFLDSTQQLLEAARAYVIADKGL